TRIRKADRPTAALYSVDPNGGNVRVEAHGIHYPRGLAFNEFGNLYLTNDGMELRGTRPVKDDPDVLLKFAPRAWYGWPDFSADFRPITDEKFQPPPETIVKSSYSELSFVIDHNASNAGEGLIAPSYARSTLLQASFPSLSGAAKFDFVPASGPLSQQFRG